MRSIMGEITNEITEFIKQVPLDKADAYPVSTYRQLVEHVAKLSYLNKDYLLFLEDKGLIIEVEQGHQPFIHRFIEVIMLYRGK